MVMPPPIGDIYEKFKNGLITKEKYDELVKERLDNFIKELEEMSKNDNIIF